MLACYYYCNPCFYVRPEARSSGWLFIPALKYPIDMLLQLVLLIAALVVAWLVFTWLVNVVKTTVQTAIIVAAIVLILQVAFGIAPKELIDQIVTLPQTVWQFVQEQINSGNK